MRIYSLFIIILFTMGATAQEKLLFYDGNWKPAKPKRAAFLVEQVKQSDTCYEWNYYVARGPRFMSVRFRDAGGRTLHGNYVAYTEGGYVDSSGQYLNGKMEGEWNVYASNHRMLYKLTYKNGKLISKKDSVQLNKEKTEEIESALAKKKIDTTIIEIESEFKGSVKVWQQYLVKNLRYPQEAIDYTVAGVVIVQFIVNKDGNVEDVDLYKSAEYYLDKEAMRLIRDSPTWTPATQNGKKVKSYKRQPIHFGLRR